jgi:hypothetical protein
MYSRSASSLVTPSFMHSAPEKRAAQRAYVTVVPRPSTPVKPAPAASPAVDVARPAEAASRAAAPIVPTGRGVTSGTPGATRRAVPATAAAHPSAPETNPTGKPVPAGKKPHPATPGGRSPAPHRSKAKGGTGAKASTEAVHAQGRAGSVGSKAAKGSSADR